MNVKKWRLAAQNPEYVFRNAQGKEVVLKASSTVADIVKMGGTIHISGDGQPLPPDAFEFVEERVRPEK